MADLLVNLLALPEPGALPDGVAIRRPFAFEMTQVLDWIGRHFEPGWADEASIAFARRPASILIAVDGGKVVGFAVFDVTANGFFGPTGVSPDHRGRGLGRALLLHALSALRQAGYAYAIIGDAGPEEFYQRTVGATVIENAGPSLYDGKIDRV